MLSSEFSASSNHWSQIITNRIIMKNFGILWKLSKCETDTWSEQVLLEKWCQRLTWGRVTTNLQFIKKTVSEVQ